MLTQIGRRSQGLAGANPVFYGWVVAAAKQRAHDVDTARDGVTSATFDPGRPLGRP